MFFVTRVEYTNIQMNIRTVEIFTNIQTFEISTATRCVEVTRRSAFVIILLRNSVRVKTFAVSATSQLSSYRFVTATKRVLLNNIYVEYNMHIYILYIMYYI